MLAQAQADPEQLALIPLRRELLLHPSTAQLGGSPNWTLEDPVRNLFFQVGRKQLELLARWDSATAGSLCSRLNQETGLSSDAEEVATLQQFLLSNALLDPGNVQVQQRLEHSAKNRRQKWISQLLNQYLFFRIPLWNPDRFLQQTLPLVTPLGHPIARLIYLIIAVVALLFLTPQWSAFFSTFPYFFSGQGMVIYGLTIFIVKFLHELGHAYTSTYYGLRVPTIGVAFIVMWPMLYSDNSDAWKTSDKRIRMNIVLAGILTEIVVAIIATFLWTLLQPGAAKSLCFVLATSSWIHSLLINFSPFMRFDGYYLLSDYLGIPNLAARAFALGRWRLRRFVLGTNTAKPEYFSPQRERLLLLYCYSTWIYRVILFTGIALMVYHLFFKALGTFLFAIEIYMFIIKPVLNEIKTWWKERHLIGCNGHIVTSATILLLMVALLLLPLPVNISIPARLIAEKSTVIYTPFPAKIDQIHIDDHSIVQRDQLLFTLSSDQLTSRQSLLTLEIAALKAQLKREMTSKVLVETTIVTANRLAAALAEAAGYNKQQQQLSIRSPLDGIVNSLSDGLTEGSWVGRTLPLCQIISQPGTRIEGYLREGDLALLPKNTTAKFIAESGDLPPLICNMTAIDRSVQPWLRAKELASIHGGDIAVVQEQNSKLRLMEARYRILFTRTSSQQQPNQQITRQVRGHVLVHGKSLSIINRIWRSLAPGFIRESDL